ncbi:uncharacterized protein M421DRAFT_423767 [Didymella exigua CBS 183.55]|uniref:BTB domain-containing protein n=1 Tax=Didymella exigua CBS 183.55 TaxID=1150837 RepID=A0A6A5RDQ6_9PLEO|nr:uncharacterized protein M421DRAFT_423767 [Didymella exigua CBS 183.55]KAF1925450.1 hypothetical protein M421DRAFT_423767 [Didymella exigua CBS 183.55]
MATTNCDTAVLANAGDSHTSDPSTVPADDATTSTGFKLKMTDLGLEVITIDRHYDLTLIVRNPDHTDGQKAFQISRSAMCHVNDIWTNMLTGKWAESKQSNVELPDDSWKALLLVLHMAHSQFAQLPDELSVEELWALAVLTDKYNLAEIVRVILELKKWLVPYKTEWTKWPLHPQIQELAEITMVFGLDEDYEYLVDRLAIEVELVQDGDTVCRKYGPKDKEVQLRPSLPDCILSKSSTVTALPHDQALIERIARIVNARDSILPDWLARIDYAVGMAITGYSDPQLSLCANKLCIATRSGVLLRGLSAAGICPRFATIDIMDKSVAFYWKGLNNIGARFKPYSTCDKTFGYGRGAHHSSCSFEQCFGDFGILGQAKIH